ncbi:stringent starvation protein B [Hydrogenophaga palleronii]|uniref:Stringent starvation protein B n=1 Tax=Hydrogenophaga palleronii TaxID=65655 RepID=A0ABU1WPZ3_9BURK|nr:ClpXP protease specificity-enhancing factor [Hydrogenophaga palleronii]MDR7151087.1 stringent starvation protein B [Hydrogenophaga palleronii]
MSALDTSTSSTRPYLIRALHEWCTDNGYSPYIAVQVDGSVQVPSEFVQNGEIVLNVSFDATSSLRLGNDCIEFKARFGGVAREIVVPISHVVAIYARENGQGMAFPAPVSAAATGHTQRVDADRSDDNTAPAAPDSTRAPLRAVPSDESAGTAGDVPEPPTDGPPRPGGRPKLKRVK